MTDYKQLCAELLKGYEILLGDLKFDNRLAKRARAALAEPEPERPTDEELESFLVDVAAEHGDIYWAEPLVLARAVLARWGRPAPQPAAGEVAELVAWLRDRAAGNDRFGAPIAAGQLNRAADLLEHLSPPQSVPVSERLPGPEDCTTNPRTGEGQWCWGWVQHDPIPYSGRWRMIRREWLVDEAKAWLPAHALPLPSSGEGEA